MIRLAALVALALAGCAGPDRTVTRVVDGREFRGRFVSVPAYAAYARGAYLEARGDRVGAQAAYQQALAKDEHSVHIRARLGALLCAQRQRQAEEHFRDAEAIDADYAPLWTERGRCHLSHDRLEEAERALERAVQLDPLAVDPNVALATVHARQGRLEDARLRLRALVLRFPESRTAAQTLRQLEAPASPDPERITDDHPRRLVDQALLDSDVDRARTLAARTGLSAGELAVRAAALGRADLAQQQAALVLGADPGDGDAWVAALVAADLARDEAAFARTVGALGQRPGTPGPLAARLLAELLRRRLGPAEAAAWLEAYGPLPSGGDQLEEAVNVRTAE